MALWATGRQLGAFIGLVVLATSAVAAAADHGEEGALPHGVMVIHAEDVIRLAQDHRDLIMIDSRTPADREIGYIEDSIPLPDDQTSCDTLSAISNNHEQPLLFYCNGINCARSSHAVQKAGACGYTKLYWFKGGYEEWQEKRFPVLRSR